MISIDSSSLIAYLQGDKGNDIDMIDEAFACHSAIMAPVVLSELLSDPKLSQESINYISSLPILEPKDGYWQRAGLNRSKLISKKVKARLADSLIAQSCIDYNIILISRDYDFRHFQKYCGLKLITP